LKENIKDKDCPCYECICVPVCKFKIYIELIRCDLVDDFLFDSLIKEDDYSERREIVRRLLHGDGEIPSSLADIDLKRS
jgi:hypothetical protein